MVLEVFFGKMLGDHPKVARPTVQLFDPHEYPLGLFGLQAAGFKPMPWLGGLLMAVGVTFIARSGGKSDGGGSGVGGKLLYPFILVAGALMAIGVVWNAQLRGALENPWLAATVSFVPVVFVFALMFLLRPSPLPTREIGRAHV